MMQGKLFSIFQSLAGFAFLFFLSAYPGAAVAQARYAVSVTGDVAQLRDTENDVVVSVLTPAANAYEMVVHGHDVLRVGIKSVDELRANPGLNGIPLLAPFANRLDGTYFFANGRKYNLAIIPLRQVACCAR